MGNSMILTFVFHRDQLSKRICACSDMFHGSQIKSHTTEAAKHHQKNRSRHELRNKKHQEHTPGGTSKAKRDPNNRETHTWERRSRKMGEINKKQHSHQKEQMRRRKHLNQESHTSGKEREETEPTKWCSGRK